jgi:hypothetical protein
LFWTVDVSLRSKQTVVRSGAAGGTARVAWPGKRSAAQVAGKNPNVGPGKRSRTQGIAVPRARRARSQRS